MKQCSKCQRLLTNNSFSPSSGGKYLRPECKECANMLSKERKFLREKYGQPDENHKCPICLKASDSLIGTGGKKHKTVWTIDHNHTTKEFRGFLCHNCNRAIGCFSDDIETLWRAIEYLMVNNNENKNY